jgi:hypothetical protein
MKIREEIIEKKRNEMKVREEIIEKKCNYNE